MRRTCLWVLLGACAVLLGGPAATLADEAGDAVGALRTYLQQDRNSRPDLAEQPFADVPLSRQRAKQVRQLLYEDHVDAIRGSRGPEMQGGVIKVDGVEMPFFHAVYGKKPANGYSLFISMHGGGGAPAQVNDQQWENQKRLYQPKEGVYVAPRAPTNTWNLWHEPHIDKLFDRLIETMIAMDVVNPDRVYIMGYSAGGDGVYQLAPRMADRLAAAAMMAGHPNDARPEGLRNIGFTLHMGGKDAAYDRNAIAGQWKERLAKLQESDPEGYEHWVEIYPEHGHWMQREDRSALPWMAKFDRNPVPNRVVWVQSNVTHPRFYWLAVDDQHRKGGTKIVAGYEGQRIEIESSDVPQLKVRLNDEMLNLDRPVEIVYQGETLKEVELQRTIGTMARTLSERGDPRSIFDAEVTIALPAE